MEKSYDFLIERITSHSGIGKDEIERKVEARRAKLSGLISREGAAQIIAAEFGVNFDNVQLKIHELQKRCCSSYHCPRYCHRSWRWFDFI